MRSALVATAALLTALSATGCIPGSAAAGAEYDGSVEGVARLRASTEFNCAAEHVQLRYLTQDSVQVKACGASATYTCPPTSRGRYGVAVHSCIREVSVTP